MTVARSTDSDIAGSAHLAPTSVQVRRLRVGGRSLVAKSAVGRARQRLRHEAELLQHLAGPDVVAFVALRESDDRTDLVTEDAGAHDLSVAVGADPDALLAAVRRTAVAVAHLHERGWSHGALCAAHVVVDSRRVTLCSLGSAQPIEAEPSSLAQDQEQLVELIHGVLDRIDPAWSRPQRRRWRRIARSVRRVTSATRVPATDPPLATAALAMELDDLGRARSPRAVAARRARHDAHVLSRSSVRLVAGMVGLASVTIGWAAMSGADPSAAHLDTSPGADVTVAAANRGNDGAAAASPSWSIRGNELTMGRTTYRVGSDGDVLTVAPLACGSPPTVLALRPSTGEVFRFDERPTAGRQVAATHVVTEPGATDLAVSDDPTCPRAVLVTADGATHPIEAVASTQPTQEEPP
jgi:tRNA A-37 threonylcarbamoyl transferase component Bud32